MFLFLLEFSDYGRVFVDKVMTFKDLGILNLDEYFCLLGFEIRIIHEDMIRYLVYSRID